MNSSLLFVLMLVSIVMIARLVETWLKEKRTKPESPDELEDTLSKISVLEERVKVLERIITENRFDLKREIDSL